jgi:hypothetical protein
MATETYILLADQTLGSAPSNLSITGIDQNYQDLVVVVTYKGGSNDAYFKMNSGTTYYYNEIVGTSSVFATNSSTSRISLKASSTRVTCAVLNIMNYSDSAKYKTVLAQIGNTSSANYRNVLGAYTNDSNTAVTSVQLENINGWASGATIRIYGIAEA